MQGFFEGLPALATTKPWLYIITMVVILGLFAVAGFIVYKLAILIISTANKAINHGVDIKGVKINPETNPDLSKVPEFPVATTNIPISNLINLIIDLPEEAIKYNNSVTNLKRQLIEDQLQNFRAELRRYRKEVRNEYCTFIKVDINSEKARLFSYWFASIFEDVEVHINSLLVRNGLNEKTAEQMEDVLRSLYEETYASVIESIEEAPPFISQIEKLREIVTESKNNYRKSLESSLNHARKLRVDAESKFKSAADEYQTARKNIIQRDFPEYMEQIEKNVK